jgi:hypothetical protein
MDLCSLGVNVVSGQQSSAVVRFAISGEGFEVVLSVIPTGLETFSEVNTAAGESISATGSVDSVAMLGAVAAALGPIGVSYLGAYGAAQANNLAGTLLVGGAHAAIGGATTASKTAYVAMDDV